MTSQRLLHALLLCGAAAFLCSCASRPAQDDPATAAALESLAGTNWMMLIPKGQSCEVPPEIEFRKDGTAAGNSGCNEFAGNWKVAGGRLLLTVENKTNRRCGKSFMALEETFGGALRRYASVKKEGKALTFLGSDGKPLAQIVPAQAGACD